MASTSHSVASEEEIKSAALHAIAFGIVVCDAEARTVHANAAAESVGRQVAVRLANPMRAISARTPEETRRLTAIIQQAARNGRSGLMRMHDSHGRVAVIALVKPLLPLRRKPAGGYALLALRPVREVATFTETMLAALFQLSSTQAAIAFALFEGQSVEHIAAERGIKVSTVRTHLAEVFVRTGTDTQRDLVRLLGSLPPLR